MRPAALLAALCLAGAQVAAQTPSDPYRLIAAARAHLAAGARDLWPGWDRTPFSLLLIDGEQEHLICDERSPPNFGPAAPEPATGCTRRSRPRTFPPGLQAAMPAFGPPSTIVVGTPEAARRAAPAWTATLLHEHFHAHQSAAPGYAERVQGLDLHGGDQTGMWMLQYAFPYDDARVQQRFSAAGRALAHALERPGEPARRAAYLTARGALAASVSAKDWRYAEFQMWQEGVARWTEIEAARSWPDEAVRAASAALQRRTLEQLAGPDLGQSKRVAFYALGAGEAMLLEACRTNWRDRYFATLAMGPLTARITDTCRPRAS